jgi:hypothetical protein
MPQHGLTTYDPKQACQGYTLYTPMNGAGAYLIDMHGAIVHRWVLPGRPGTYGYLLDNGNLLINLLSGDEPLPFGGRGARIVEFDWNGGLPGTEHEEGIWSDYFRQVTPDQQVVWEWHAYQHLDVNTDVIAPLYKRHEWTHANTCEVLPDGNVLTSFRTINTIGIIDRQSDDFVWKWGPAELGGQHDPNPLPNGHILVFDNGWYSRRGVPFPTSRVLEVDPKTDEIIWSYETKPGWEFFSSFISGAQRLDNGNTLICEGMRGRIFEVTPAGEIVWQFVNPFYGYSERFGNVNIVFRAYRYSADFAGFQNKTFRPETHAWLNHLYT